MGGLPHHPHPITPKTNQAPEAPAPGASPLPKTTPHAWGAEGPCLRHPRQGGSIPTCVGLRSSSVSVSTVSAVHPHVRGAQWRHDPGRTAKYGPSPRAWGSGVEADRVGVASRSIPACAGSSAWPSCVPVDTRVHPRVRGEQCAFSWTWESAPGPSPHTRGLDHRSLRHHRDRQSIPTCVGFRAALAKAFELAAVHPHVRGAQGTRGYRGVRVGRSIPTCVGLSPSPTGGHSNGSVHPRVRREQLCIIEFVGPCRGPSPRAWGADPQPHRKPRRPGSIPTCAGSRPVRCWIRSGMRGHPRVRGEQPRIFRG